MADQDDDLENDVDSSDASGDLNEASGGDDSGPSPAPTGSPDSSMNPILKAHLNKLRAAQEQANKNELFTNLARANAYLSTGLAHSNQPVNEAPFNAMAATDQQPVQNVLDEQKAAAADLKQQKELRSIDPNSPESLATKSLIKRLYPGKFTDDDLKNLSASDIGESVMKPLELDEKIQSHKDEMLSRAADRATLKHSQAQDKAEKDHDKYVQHVEDAERGWRSDPASMRYDTMMSAAASGKALIDKYRGHEDDMPIQDVHALVADRLKAISGGTPTEKDIEAQMPPAATNRKAMIEHPWATITGQQHPGEAGDFVRNIDSTFQEMERTARAGLQHRQESVASSPKLSPEERQRVVNIGIPEPAYHQYEPDVLSYAKEHNITPDQAAAVKAKRTGSVAGYAFGGQVQPPAFRPVRMPHPQAVKMPHAPKPPKDVMPKMDAGMTSPAHFACGGEVHAYEKGGQVPGQPAVPFNSPKNDVVDAKLTPKEVVLPLSVTQAKDPALAAYLFMKSLKQTGG